MNIIIVYNYIKEFGGDIIKGIKHIVNRAAYVIILTFAYAAYAFLDYKHHVYLEKNVSKNMVWLGYFRYGNTCDFSYSADFVFFTIIYIVLLGVVSLKKQKIKL